MKALSFDGRLSLANVDEPVPRPGEALVRVCAAGVCRTDLEIIQGYMKFRGVLGHEFVGVVERCDSVPERIGQRIVGEINVAPGVADELWRRHAPGRQVLGIAGRDGCFAERICLPVENLHAVPDGVGTRAAVFAEPLAAALEITEQVHIRPTDRVAVLGDGRLGLLVAQVLRLSSSDLVLFGRHGAKLRIASGLGIRGELAGRAQGREFDVVVDCTGSPAGLQASLALVRPRGTLILKTTTAAPPDFHTAALVIDEITVVGSRCGPMAPALRLLDAGLVQVQQLVEAVYNLRDGISALEHAARPGALKVLLDIDGSLGA